MGCSKHHCGCEFLHVCVGRGDSVLRMEPGLYACHASVLCPELCPPTSRVCHMLMSLWRR
jgi:hypothetical protein